jgi:hypothetical protein
VDDDPAAPPDEDEPLGADDDGDDEDVEPLGDELEPDAPDEDEPLGDADGLLEPLADACTPSFEAVSLSSRPVAFRPSFCWYSRSACRVFGPMMPSTSPGSAPLSFSACWTAFTCSMLPPAPALWLDLPAVPPAFMSLADEPAPVPELVAADEPPLVDGDADVLPDLLLFVSVLAPLPADGLLVAPAPDDVPVALLPDAPPEADPLCANADVASIAPPTVSASALIHVFITVLLLI